jgi:hypothetical protein
MLVHPSPAAADTSCDRHDASGQLFCHPGQRSRLCCRRKVKFNIIHREENLMRKYMKLAIVSAVLAFGPSSAMSQGYTPSPQDAPHVKRVTAYALANIKPFLSDPVVVNAVKAQNAANAKLKSYEINKLDNGWMDRSAKELIDSKMNNELSTFLRKKKEAANGVIFEIFVVDEKGLNVGETDLTQDYNQGDEAKYWKSYGAGPDAIWVDKVGKDGGKNVSQVSLTIKDPATGKAIGAVTVGIDVDKLK